MSAGIHIRAPMVGGFRQEVAMRQTIVLQVMCVLISLGVCAGGARATDFNWNAPAPGNGLFASPFNWSPFIFQPPIIGPPGPGEMATFDRGNGVYTVTFNNNHTNSRCRIG